MLWTRSLVAGALLISLAACADCGGTPGVGGDDGGTGGVTVSSSSSSSSGGVGTSSSSSSSGGTSSGDGGVGDGGVGDGGEPTVLITSVDPGFGTVQGGCNNTPIPPPPCRVTIRGAGFTAPGETNELLFGGNPATGIIRVSDTVLTAFLPTAAGPGAVDVSVTNPRGTFTLPEGFTYIDAVRVDSIDPAVVPTTGGTTVTINGVGFQTVEAVLLGSRSATGLVVAEDGNSLTVVTPPHVAGRVDVELVSQYGTSKMLLGLRYVAPVTITRVDPAVGPLAGDNVVSVHGTGFSETTVVTFGGQAARVVDFVGEDELRVAVPAGSAAGTVDVVVSEPTINSVATLADGYGYLADGAAPQLTVVAPNMGPVEGGTEVHLYGVQLQGANLEVRFGTTLADAPQVLSAGHLVVNSPSATAAGAVDVSVTRDGTTLTATGAFTYKALVTLTQLDPAGGPDVGGTPLIISGSNLSDACIFTLGGQVLDVLVSDPSTATSSAPPGSAGSVDLEVTCPDAGSAILKDAYTYDSALQILGVEPIRGAMAGGTYVLVRGTGFASGPNLKVLFDASEAINVNVVSDNLLTAYTPSHGPGAVDVKVTLGQQTSTRTRAFTYYDPSAIVGGVKGGAINGSVNITAIDIVFGFPIPEALAVLGTETGAEYTGFTDMRGQVTLSGPDVFGQQTVTVAHCNYSYVTLGGVNASDITVYMFPMMPPRCGTPSPPSPPPPPPPLPPPPVISGKVTGFAKELFDPANLGPNEVAAAFVTHTWPSPFSYPPAQWQMASSQIVFVEGGQYVIPAAWRTGPMAIIGIAGIYNVETGEFFATQIGFNRGLIADLGGVYENRDVELTIPLTKRLTIQFPDAPYDQIRALSPGVGVGNILIPYLNLGGEGAHPVYGWERQGSDELEFTLENFAEAPGDLFTFIARYLSLTETNLPYSTVLQDGEGPLGPAIALSPLMGFPELLSPTENGVMEGRVFRIKPMVGTQPSFYELTFSTLDGTTWYAYMEGNRTKMILPKFPEFPTEENAPPNMPAGGVSAQLEAVYVPGFDYNNWSYLELWGLARRSWSDMTFRFINSGN
ncbi:MAG: IPT/TIG domain-containing protein [Myxococcota bacterium]